jgi:hypothetical protein
LNYSIVNTGCISSRERSSGINNTGAAIRRFPVKDKPTDGIFIPIKTLGAKFLG